jgi:hypothetical protein
MNINFDIAKGNTLADLAGRLALALALYAGFALTIRRMLFLDGLRTNSAAVFGVGALFCVVVCVCGRRRSAVSALIVIALALYVVLARSEIADGFCIAANRVFEGFEYRFGRIFPYYETETPYAARALMSAMFLVVPTVLLSVFAACAAGARSVLRFVFPLLAAAIWAAAVIWRLRSPDPWFVLMCLAAAALRVRGVSLTRVAPLGGKVLLPLFLQLVLIMAIAAASATLFYGLAPSDAAFARRSVAEFARDLRYGAEETEKGLEVSLGASADMFLRGRSADTLSGREWTRTPPEVLSRYAKLFSWLHADGFYGQVQYAILADTLDMTRATAVSVENIGASSEYIYAPYGVTEVETDRRMIGDGEIKAAGLRGEREYAYVSAYPIEMYEELFDALYRSADAGEPGALEYLSYESAYRDFIYETCLDVPDYAKPELAESLSSLRLERMLVPLSFRDAVRVVSACREQWTDRSRDRLATMTALMFRYLGIPARYAEGFYLSDGATSPYVWAEIYRDGVGFVPYETAEQNIVTSEDGASAQSGGSDGSGASEEPPEEPETPPESFPWIWLLLLLAILLLGAVLFIVIRRYIAIRRYRRLFSDPDNNEATAYMTAYIVKLFGHMGVARQNGSLLELAPKIEELFGEEPRRGFIESTRANREAMYSGKGIRDEVREDVKTYLNEVLSRLKASSGALKRLRLKWILRVY